MTAKYVLNWNCLLCADSVSDKVAVLPLLWKNLFYASEDVSCWSWI